MRHIDVFGTNVTTGKSSRGISFAGTVSVTTFFNKHPFRSRRTRNADGELRQKSRKVTEETKQIQKKVSFLD